jgi:ABC-2 type transport system permease protein
MNIVFTPYGWEWRIRTGQLSASLLRPLHPLHSDISFFAGWKFVVIVLWLPLAAFLSLVFKPALNPTLLEIGVSFGHLGRLPDPHHAAQPAGDDHILDHARWCPV